LNGPPVAVPAGVDAQRPWIGLASFTEESRRYFHGREEEVGELARRVQRKLLTVMFGQSGLGKTSILRAGLVPRLRDQGYCPVYVRVDYSADAPEPSEQIKRAISQAASGSGAWTHAGIATSGETLWEFLHHRDDVLKDARGQTLIPLLIFDQFEEIFTLAQSDEAGRSRAARFVAELADLVENRPPAAFEAKLEGDEHLAERFDFSRSDYRVLIALREDYLAQLESLKSAMPSVTQNRQRLAPMNGKQALQAVQLPGQGLVTPEVAEAIVRFVAGGAEIDNAEVEPSLLSLICRELNDTRLARGAPVISLDLLAGSHEEILADFYERALVDQPPQVRRIIEDDLLTDSGFRENIAEERLRKSLDAAGAAPDTLAKLVDRRLLRVEERLDLRRVELTHDVLCGVVRHSRDLRQEREAREATERQLAQQHEREQASRKALRRALQVAAVCGVLAVLAVAAAVHAWLSTQRAQRAEQVAQASRTQAESLLGYLTNDFAEELTRTGRLDVIAALALHEVEYFHALPEALKGPETRHLGALALVQLGRALRSQGRLDEADAAIDEALDLLKQLEASGWSPEETAIATARALGVRARIQNTRQDDRTVATAEQALAVIAPVAARPEASEAARKTGVELQVALGYQYQNAGTANEKAIAVLQAGMARAAEYGGKDPQKNLYMAERYSEAGGWLTTSLIGEGRLDEANRVGRDAAQVAEAILQMRPGNFSALYSLGLIEGYLGAAAKEDMRPADSLPFYERATEVYTTITRLDPGNRIYANNRASQYWDLSGALWSLGRIRESQTALAVAAESMELAGTGGASLFLSRLRLMGSLGDQFAQVGDFERARQIHEEMIRLVGEFRASLPPDSVLPHFAAAQAMFLSTSIAGLRGDWKEVRRQAEQTIADARDLPGGEGVQRIWKSSSISFGNQIAAEAQWAMGDFKSAERSAREGYEERKSNPQSPLSDGTNLAAHARYLALALVGQKRDAEAREAIAPAVAFMRDVQKRNRQDEELKVAVAKTLYVEALTDPARRAALLREAAAIIDATPLTIQSLGDVRLWRNRIRAAGGA
jgi:tetratricopeptide (TPR) repeat protein